MATDTLFLVTGATGTQGGATARALLAAGHRVRVLTRSPASDASKALARLGAEVAQGDMETPDTLAAAMLGAYGVFSVLQPDASGGDSERRHGLAMIDAARAAGVQHFVHTGVCQAGQHESFPRWGTGYWSEAYWLDKWAVEQAIRAAGFRYWTLLRPTFLMENFTHRRAQFLFPQMRGGTILTPILPDVTQQLIAGEDIGAIACAAFEKPEKFSGKTIDLAGDRLTMGETAAVLSKVLEKNVVARSVSPEEAKAAGLFDRWVRALEWVNEVGYHGDTSELPGYGVPMTRYAEWVKRHADEIVIDS